MSKYSDLVDFLKYIKEEEKDRPKRRWREAKHNPFDALAEIQETATKWKMFVENLDKINKKEEKKGWDALSFPQKLVLMTAIVPFIVVMQLMLPTILLIRILNLHQ
jgi:acyl-CoA reductase-like NAD-dependent aldehyde dehydrogenase